METNGNKKTFILDKEGGVTRGFTPEELVLRIPEMLRLQRREENIYYTPLSEEKHHVLIDDMTAEALAFAGEQLLACGHSGEFSGEFSMPSDHRKTGEPF